MTVTLTESAAQQISRQLAKRGGGIGLKLGVKKSGCSGFAYTLDYADAVTAEQLVFESCGVKVIINSTDLAFLNGIELDYRREGINAAFQFNNPNVTAVCGCGESFAVDPR